MAITALPPVPSRSDTPANFIAKADAFLAALSTFRTEANAVAEAMNLNAVTAISTTGLTIGTGAKSLTVETNKSYAPGMTVKIASTADGTKWMLGDVTAYNPGTGALAATISVAQGAGTFAAWTVTQSAPGGAAPGANTDITSLQSPELGAPTAITHPAGHNTTHVATTAFSNTAATNAAAAVNAAAVHLTGNETIAGVKTFSDPPVAINMVKAWVNFDGTASGTIVPRAYYNIPSVTKTGTGQYKLNIMAGVLADANYAAIPQCRSNNATSHRSIAISANGQYLATACDLYVTDSTAGNADSNIVTCAILGN